MDVLVLGGGYAGLTVTRKLERRLPASATLTLVDDTGSHLVQHELHRAVRDPDYVDEISVPLAEILDRAALREGEVTGVDRESRTVSLADGDTLDYDYCVVALGAETAFYDVPGVEAHATPLKRLEHAAEIRREFEAVVDEFGHEDPVANTERTGTVVVGGAGLSGVQVAGELAVMAREREVAESVEIVLLEQEETVAPGFPEQFQTATRERLDAQNVDVRTGATVTAADEATITVADGAAIDYDQFVWTGGIRGNGAMGGERPQVRGDLRLDERTFALGDAVRIVDADGEPVPASASAAVRAAETAARNVVAAATADGGFVDLAQWHWESPGWLISVGDDAVAQIGPTVLTGSTANALKSAVGITYLAEHGSLRHALGVLRKEMDDTGEFGELLKRL
ncbi:FAD-dependent oxidoreductase [Halolamina sp. CBA1230]|uniref:NAD(P)/FAD-dependent oxidoreductase n=1 Tax=Halolamina sp. CBA1230 TaxID=1853690 RepID=UPI0009A24B6E|nr:FAD-dependent oxidoreductase [Halolamina sp. CBA1230]QKY19444.1 FAD-dependent oxidoreductase [Halolamina sp. CBA1230]